MNLSNECGADTEAGCSIIMLYRAGVVGGGWTGWEGEGVPLHGPLAQVESQSSVLYALEHLSASIGKLVNKN